jgi:hypothetical protein
MVDDFIVTSTIAVFALRLNCMAKTKVIVVATPLGRTGSSAMMGLLKLSGVNVGNKTQLVAPAPINPKGFFELVSQQKFLEQVYTGIYPELSIPPSLNRLQYLGKLYCQDYLNLVKNEFGNASVLAVKSPRFLTIPFLYELREQLDVRVIVMNRKLEDQVSSILRVWQNSNEPTKKYATREFVSEWIVSWRRYSQHVQNSYDLKYLQIEFDDLVINPLVSMEKVTQFIGIKCPSKRKITRFIEPDLVNRSVLTNASIQLSKFNSLLNNAKYILTKFNRMFNF